MTSAEARRVQGEAEGEALTPAPSVALTEPHQHNDATTSVAGGSRAGWNAKRRFSFRVTETAKGGPVECPPGVWTIGTTAPAAVA